MQTATKYARINVGKVAKVAKLQILETFLKSMRTHKNTKSQKHKNTTKMQRKLQLQHNNNNNNCNMKTKYYTNNSVWQNSHTNE